MKYQFKYLIGSSAILLFATGSAFAGGAYLTELGSPLSVGTAGVASVTNTIGPDSAFTNPAGMTGLDGEQFLGGTQLVFSSVRFDSDSDTTAGGSDGGNAGETIGIPSMFYVNSLNQDLRFGIGATAQLGAGVDYGKDFVGRYHAQRSVLSGYGISPSMAYRVNEKLSLGAGVSFIYTAMDLHFALNQPGAVSDGQVRFDGLDDWGYQGFLGVIYKPSDLLTIGMVYRSESDAELEGDLKFRNVQVPVLNQLTSSLDNGGIDYTYPQIIRVGLKYQITDETQLMADFDWEEWSAFGKTGISMSGSLANPVIVEFDRGWDDTYHIGFAVVHQLANNQHLTAGVGYDSSPVSDSRRTADLPADEQLRLSLAYGEEISENMSFALGGTYLWLGKGKMDQVVQGERYSGEFSTNIVVFLSASLKYKF